MNKPSEPFKKRDEPVQREDAALDATLRAYFGSKNTPVPPYAENCPPRRFSWWTPVRTIAAAAAVLLAISTGAVVLTARYIQNQPVVTPGGSNPSDSTSAQTQTDNATDESTSPESNVTTQNGLWTELTTENHTTNTSLPILIRTVPAYTRGSYPSSADKTLWETLPKDYADVNASVSELAIRFYRQSVPMARKVALSGIYSAVEAADYASWERGFSNDGFWADESKEMPTVWSFVRHFSIPRERFEADYNTTTENGTPRTIFTAQELDAIYAEDMQTFWVTFANPYAVVQNGKVYVPAWLTNRDIEGWRQYNLSVWKIEDCLNKLQVQFPQDAIWTELQETVADYCHALQLRSTNISLASYSADVTGMLLIRLNQKEWNNRLYGSISNFEVEQLVKNTKTALMAGVELFPRRYINDKTIKELDQKLEAYRAYCQQQGS